MVELTDLPPNINFSNHEENIKIIIDEDERRLARRARIEIESSGKVHGKTRLYLAQNLGKILSKFGRELSRDELARIALNTTNIKPSERLGRYQIKPGKKISDKAEKRLSKSPLQYLKLAETAAELTGGNQNLFLLELVDGTKFDVRGKGGEEIVDVKPLERLEEVIKTHCELIIKKYGVTSYITERHRYRANASQKSPGELYKFESSQLNYFENQTVSFQPLFSILKSEGICEWREGNRPWLKRPIEFVEKVQFGFFFTEDHQVFAAFRIFPEFYLPSIRKEKGKSFYSETKVRPPFDMRKPWVGSGKVHECFLTEINDKGELGKYPGILGSSININKIPVIRLPRDHGLDLSKFNEVWFERLDKPYPKSNTATANPIIDRLGLRALSTWFDVPVKNIRRRPYDAFYCDLKMEEHAGPQEPKFDASRGISPPNSFLAEVEVGLYYDGFQGIFDDNSRDYSLSEPGHRDYDYDEDGNPIEVCSEDIDLTYTNTFLDLLENDVSSQVVGFSKWLDTVKEEGFQHSEAILHRLEKELGEIENKK